ncbi:MAG: hypothetical protein ACRD0X_07355 [Thermoanaerobaculia bacterium]
MRRFRALSSALLLALPAAASAEIVVITFDPGTNTPGFAMCGCDVEEPAGGNPGFWLHAPTLDTTVPVASNDPLVDSEFNGDFRAMEVVRLAIDARLDHTDFPVEGLPFSILLYNNRGTPAQFDDDDWAYFVGPDPIPVEGEGWVHYDFAIPSQATEPVPEGWGGGHPGDPENFREGVDWNDIVTAVSDVQFWYGDPRLFYIFQMWDVGVDNVTLETTTIFADGFESGDTSAWSAVVP